MEDQLKEYRKHLVLAEQKAQEDFDKAVLSLSGGALGISIAFMKDIIGTDPAVQLVLLLAAWACWGLSVVIILWSYFTSQRAMREAIKQVDVGKIYNTHPGGNPDKLTAIFNFIAGVLFPLGVGFMAAFVWFNLGA